MALSDKNIVITPNVGGSAGNEPKIVFSGADATTGPQNVTIAAYPLNSGTVAFEASNGQLFSVNNSLTGSIFSANDVSGIPSIEVTSAGLVKLAQYSGRVLIGTGNDDGITKFQVAGNMSVTGTISSGGSALTSDSQAIAYAIALG